MGRSARLAAAALLLMLPAALRATPAAAEGEGAAPAPPVREARTIRLSLKETVALALRNNLDLQAAAYEPPMASTEVAEAESLYDFLYTARLDGGEAKAPANSWLLPADAQNSDDFFRASTGVQRLLPWGGTVLLSANSDRTLTNSTYSYYNPFWQSGLGITASQPLLRGFGREVTESGIRLARDRSDLANLDFRRTVEDKVRAVETLYWELVRARGVHAAQLKSLDVARDLMRVNQARLDAGAGTKVDVSQSAAGVAAREVDVLRSENDLRSVEELLLGEILPRSPDNPEAGNMRVEPVDDAAADLPALPAEAVEAAVEEALLRRTDVRLRRVAVDQSEVDVVRAESAALSRLDMVAAASYTGTAGNLGSSWSDDGVGSRENGSWSVGLVLEVPIGNRAARARLERSVLNRSRMESLLRAQQSDAAVRVRNSRRDLESARKELEAAARATALAEEQLEAERERLRNDKSTTFEVLRLESDLTNARLSELRAQTDYRTAVVNYDFERGRILEARGIEPPPGAAK